MSVQLPTGVLTPVMRNHGGVHAEYRKNTSQAKEVILPTPARVSIPMRMHIGAPCVPTVSVGEIVEVGQLIADSKAAVSAPIHASVSGKVKAIKEVPSPADGSLMQVIEIESDGEMRPWSGIKKPEITSKDEFIAAVRASGLVGLGGAGFPTHFKLNVKPGQVDILVANGAECEPYITTDQQVMEHSTELMLDGILEVMRWLDLDRCIIPIEDNKMQAIEKVVQTIQAKAEKYKGIQVMALPASYPKGAEKVIIQNATGRIVPVGKLPADVGVLVMNVTTLAVLANYIQTGEPLTSKLVTVDGGAIAEPKNVRVPIGTPIQELIDFCGGFAKTPRMILMGGPMMGTPLSNTDFSILKQNNAVLALVAEDYVLETETACIRCGACVDACPMLLSPTEMMRSISFGNAEKAKALGVETCMECGCCAFSCPAHIQLVQYFREGKKMVRKLGGKK